MPLPLIDRPGQAKARLVLAHGAGAGASHPWLELLAQQLCLNDIEVWRFNFPYMQRRLMSGTKGFPDKMPILQQAFAEQLLACPTDLPLFIGGKSLGGRVASMLIDNTDINAVFAFGYPFHAPGKSVWRTAHFEHLKRPLFILQGERDAFGNRAEIVDDMWQNVELTWLKDGDHDFKPRKVSGVNQQQLIIEAARRCSEKIDEILLAN